VTPPPRTPTPTTAAPRGGERTTARSHPARNGSTTPIPPRKGWQGWLHPILARTRAGKGKEVNARATPATPTHPQHNTHTTTTDPRFRTPLAVARLLRVRVDEGPARVGRCNTCNSQRIGIAVGPALLAAHVVELVVVELPPRRTRLAAHVREWRRRGLVIVLSGDVGVSQASAAGILGAPRAFSVPVWCDLGVYLSECGLAAQAYLSGIVGHSARRERPPAGGMSLALLAGRWGGAHCGGPLRRRGAVLPGDGQRA
jgi:hypothetical protein